jgi:hypothetical protein
MLTFLFSLLISFPSAHADGKPFFTELQIHGGMLGNPGVGFGPMMGGTSNWGIDLGAGGFENNVRLNYSAPLVGSTLPYIAELILSLRARLFVDKWAFKIGPAWTASTLVTGTVPTSLISNWGLGPSFGIHYLSSAESFFYAGFGLDVNAFVLAQSGLTLAQRFQIDGSATLYIGVRSSSRR